MKFRAISLILFEKKWGDLIYCSLITDVTQNTLSISFVYSIIALRSIKHIRQNYKRK